MNNCYIALVGKNPLPIYVSALESYVEGDRIFLVYTNENRGYASSRIVAENIEESLMKKLNNPKIKLIACDKSDIELIEKTIKEIKEKIRFYTIENIILDYTGGTKMMATLFCNKFSQDHNCKFTYVSFTNKEIYKHTSLDDFHEVENPKSIELIIDKFKINTDDVINLHGYHCSNENNLVFIDKKGNTLENCDLINVEFSQKDFRLILKFEKTVAKAKEIKNSYFEYKNIGEKIGGTEVKIIISVNLKSSDGELKGTVEKTKENLIGLISSNRLEIKIAD